ncbi:RNA polymerase sigma factor [[Flexibacter] sp. ATCC 35208]|uniref:RNA polymerase sigma factor n=1 Tax=[Flexibacter] sp. ATCC 35208 TaxID=1936242 RepID=UPI0009D1A32F|nr:sigma-70 family RNA polymerase sigma factor [[Flexibacter] sp. ATCC 35208]OMP78040.1 RNA polymerase sigma-70 factor [[Flexibacter] sp. ATCC 35208]
MCLGHLSDHELWESILKGDQVAFSYFFKKHWQSVYTTVFFHLKDREVSKEITHDIFLNIWLKREQLEILSFSAYLKAAGRYHVYKHLKKQKVKPLSFNEDIGQLDDYAVQNEGYQQLSRQELEDSVEEFVRRLPKRCREVFLLSRQEHLSNDQIAGKLGISKRTVENQITYALHHLRTMLKVISIFLF